MKNQNKRRPHLEAFLAVLAMNGLSPNIPETIQEDQKMSRNVSVISKSSWQATDTKIVPINQDNFS